jgi:transcriptional regulator with XRE-family HTH domain
MKEAIAAMIGKHVTAKRQARGMTQEEIAKLAGITRQTISLIESGTQTPGWETVYILAGILRCEVYDLLPTVRQVRAQDGQ